MQRTLDRPVLRGSIPSVPSKSEAHRALIAAALSDRPTFLHRVGGCEDVQATCRVLRAMGVGLDQNADGFVVTPPRSFPARIEADCGESGATLRFLLPVTAALCPALCFTLRGRLPDRPLAPLVEQLSAHGARVTGTALLRCAGKLHGGDFALAGDVSSQFASGLLMALTRLGGRLSLHGSIQSRPYLDMTLAFLRAFGAEIEEADATFTVNRCVPLRSPGAFTIGGDWSNAAFFLVAGAIGRYPVTVEGLAADTPQGDRAIVSLLTKMGARARESQGAVTVCPAPLHAIDVDAAQRPDLVPPLCAAACVAEGTTRFLHAGRLRDKESDRLETLAALVNRLGGNAEISGDMLLVTGGRLRGGTLDAAGDHRVAMSAAILATRCEGSVLLSGSEAVAKSYPDFWRDYGRLRV